MPEISARTLVATPTLTVRDTHCRGTCRHKSVEECTRTTQLVFPYRGVYVRHIGQDQAVAESNQMVCFNATEGYQISHPVVGGDSSLTFIIAEEHLRELAPLASLRKSSALAFRQQTMRIDAQTQTLVALLRHRLDKRTIEPLEAESLAIAIVQRALGPRTSWTSRASEGLRRLADRAKLVLASDLARRWTLAEVATQVRVSPVYLTQVFQQVEGVPLYRYQLQLRLARALDLVAQCDDLTSLGLDLGFSSHSHFTAAFRQTYGHSPSRFRQSIRHA